MNGIKVFAPLDIRDGADAPYWRACGFKIEGESVGFLPVELPAGWTLARLADNSDLPVFFRDGQGRTRGAILDGLDGPHMVVGQRYRIHKRSICRAHDDPDGLETVWECLVQEQHRLGHGNWTTLYDYSHKGPDAALVGLDWLDQNRPGWRDPIVAWGLA